MEPLTNNVEIETYPVAIIQDRYRGTYAGAEWIAIANADEADCELDVEGTPHKVGGVARVQYCLMDGPHASDVEAMRFWNSPPEWIAVGNTPDEARDALYAKLGVQPPQRIVDELYLIVKDKS